MAITVKNSTSFPIDVAINEWGDGGSTGYFPIAKGAIESWNRSDPHGFVMAVSLNGVDRPYYVLPGYDVVVSDEHNISVTVGTTTKQLQPLSS